MANTTTDLVGVYDDYENAERAQNALIERGFDRSQIHIEGNNPPRTQAAGSPGTYGGTPTEQGGVSGFFHRLFGDNHEDTGHYSEAVTRGSSVLTATVDDSRVEEASEILNRFNPVDFDQRISEYGRATAGTSVKTGVQDVSAGRTIPVVKEDLQVGKRAVQRGGVRVYSRVTQRPVEEDVTLREEHVRVDRRPVDRAATDADLRRRDEVIEVVETSEEPVIAKTARVVEEIVVGKEATQRTEHVRDTLRETDVRVERIPGDTAARTGTTVADDYSDDYRRDFQTRYATEAGASYDTYAPAYQYGSTVASDARYRGKNWSDVEDTLRTDYLKNNPNSAWDRVKGSIRYGYEKTTNKR